MAIHDFSSQRLFLDADLKEGVRVPCTPEQANYLLNVLRLREGAEVLVFNGRDGEWRACITGVGKRAAVLAVGELARAQASGPDITYLFAPLKRSRLDYMVQKAVEMGVAALVPVMTRRTVAERVNIGRMRANAIEAAEQCGVLRLPLILEPEKLEKVLQRWDAAQPLIFCDEDTAIADPVRVLNGVRKGPVGLLVGPEGGFAPEERDLIRSRPFAVPLSLGPRIMRADTAAVAALALVNATLGDWI